MFLSRESERTDELAVDSFLLSGAIQNIHFHCFTVPVRHDQLKA
jgi:hypothetical protein